MVTFRDLRIWKEAHGLRTEIIKSCKGLPKYEDFIIRSQIERSSSSVADNIAESYSAYYYKEKIKILYIARKEASETQNHLITMETKNYIDYQRCDCLLNRYESLIRGINAYINYIRRKIVEK